MLKATAFINREPSVKLSSSEIQVKSRMPHPCPLCQSESTTLYAQDKRRSYAQCQQCHLVFADPQSWPSSDAEKAEYDQHENDVADDGYNRFLSRMVEPLQARLPTQAHVLDFGCGPAPALANQLTALGHRVSLYDVFYHPTLEAFKRQYQGIVLTEVIEHLHTPMQELQRLWQCLEPGGVLAIMTQRVINQARFQTWQYKNDPTHVCFYSDDTFAWLATQFDAAALDFVGRDMVFLSKKAAD